MTANRRESLYRRFFDPAPIPVWLVICFQMAVFTGAWVAAVSAYFPEFNERASDKGAIPWLTPANVSFMVLVGLAICDSVARFGLRRYRDNIQKIVRFALYSAVAIGGSLMLTIGLAVGNSRLSVFDFFAIPWSGAVEYSWLEWISRLFFCVLLAACLAIGLTFYALAGGGKRDRAN